MPGTGRFGALGCSSCSRGPTICFAVGSRMRRFRSLTPSLDFCFRLSIRPDGWSWVLCALIVTWGNDTCAYFVGRLFGHRKLYPEVSPNKTWEGFAGGFVGSLVGMFVARGTFFPALSVPDCLWVGAIGGIVGPIGDLSESMLKRAYQVKDSGKLIPGHGGLLDRLDALLFNTPLIFLYANFLRGNP